MQMLSVVPLGELFVVNPEEGEPPFLSAASGCAWSQASGKFYTVGDDQAAVAVFDLAWHDIQEALREGEAKDILQAGVAQRIIPDVLPLDPSERKEAKADFEAQAIVKREHIDAVQDEQVRGELQRRFPWGLLLIAGSGGMSWGGTRRSIAVVYSLDEKGNIIGLPSRISFEGLHAFLEQHVVSGQLNIEGVCVHRDQLVLAQRGNSTDDKGRPAPNMLIRLNLAEVLRSLYTDLRVDQCELEEVMEYELGWLPLEVDGRHFSAKLDFTDIDSVAYDPLGRLVFTAAAEATGDPIIDGKIAGSVVGVIGADGEVERLVPLADTSIKLEGVDARYNPTTGAIDLLLVSDADDPAVPAPLLAARL